MIFRDEGLATGLVWRQRWKLKLELSQHQQ